MRKDDSAKIGPNDNSSLVPPLSNTQSTAQPATLPNSHMNAMKQGPSLPTSSSLSGFNVPASINQNLQKMLQVSYLLKVASFR